MLDAILSLIPGGGLTAIIGAVGMFLLAAWRLIAHGRKLERADSDRARVDALEDRLEMERESTEAERQAAGMSDEEARKEALKWAKR